MTTIDNSQNIIDSRDIIARIEELESLSLAQSEALEALGLVSDGEESNRRNTQEAQDELDAANEAFGEDEKKELASLKAFAAELENYGDWKHGETLIRDDYFEDYAKELAHDIGALSKDCAWPASCIDWEQAAYELQQDYTSADFDGITYWMRA